MSGEAVRVAMWSGPRNISTAMMRAFGARADAVVADEPFYAAYLAATGLDHPMRAAVLAAGPTDPDEAVRRVLAPLPAGKTVFYQKHMTHHMRPGFDRGWFARVRHAFLIRRPEDVVASYGKRREQVRLADIGFTAQLEIFEEVATLTGTAPPVVDAADILAAPEAMLVRVCAALGIPFDPAMLSWPAGPRPSDGVWGAHWYAAVNRSTGFAPLAAPVPREALDPAGRAVADAARPVYERLARHALRPAPMTRA